MKKRYLFSLPFLLGVLVTGCRQDRLGGVDVVGRNSGVESKSVITMVLKGNDGVIRLAMDALPDDRDGVWIDLDGDGVRAIDTSENVTVFDESSEYRLAPGLNTVRVHGDVTYLSASSIGCVHADVSGNPSLRTLHLPSNDLTTVNLSGNPALESLDVSNNRIEVLDLSANSHLRTLWCFNNRLADLDLSKNRALVSLDCSGNMLATLDLSQNSSTASIVAYNNRLTNVVFSSSDAIGQLWLFGNLLTESEVQRITTALGRGDHRDLWLSGEPMEDTTTSNK